MEEVESQFKGPKNQFLIEIEEKAREITVLNQQISQKQRDLIQMNSDQERFKI